MWHDALWPILSEAVQQPSSNSNQPIVIAIITVGLPLVGTLAGLIITAARRGDKQALPAPPPPAPLNSAQNDDTEGDALRKRVAVLERFLFLQHYDPTKIRRGTEKPSEVHFE